MPLQTMFLILNYHSSLNTVVLLILEFLEFGLFLANFELDHMFVTSLQIEKREIHNEFSYEQLPHRIGL